MFKSTVLKKKKIKHLHNNGYNGQSLHPVENQDIKLLLLQLQLILNTNKVDKYLLWYALASFRQPTHLFHV